MNRILCPKCPAPENHLGGNAPRATDEKLLRDAPLSVSGDVPAERLYYATSVTGKMPVLRGPPVNNLPRHDRGRDGTLELPAIEGGVAALGAAFGGAIGPFKVGVEDGEVGGSTDGKAAERLVDDARGVGAQEYD